jgi:molybdopterin synthase sulfur carrier subunit
MMRVLFFGSLRDAAGCASMSCDLPRGVESIADLRAWLGARDSVLGAALDAPGVRVAVDQTFADNSAPARHAREIAFMSPLSGG